MKLLFFILIFYSTTYADQKGVSVNRFVGPIDQMAHHKVDGKINDLYSKALSCRPLEKDGNYTVVEWMKYKPTYPNWKNLAKLVRVAPRADREAERASNYDKAKHCFAGCFIRKATSHNSAALIGWIKELKDASDCNPLASRFEVEDYLATLAGSLAGGVTDCYTFCSQATLENKMSGTQLMKATDKLIF